MLYGGCIKSVLIQDADFELTVIDDNSKDTSYDILGKIPIRDSRDILITKENRDVSKTRNQGLKVAPCDYITFLDCDDWISLGL